MLAFFSPPVFAVHSVFPADQVLSIALQTKIRATPHYIRVDLSSTGRDEMQSLNAYFKNYSYTVSRETL